MIIISVFFAASVLQEDVPALAPPLKASADRSIEAGIKYYRGIQNDDGSFAEGDFAPAITALVSASVLRTGKTLPDDPMLAKSLAFLEKFVQEDGSIAPKGSPSRNYPTAIAILAFSEANTSGKYDKLLADAAEFLKRDQWDEGEGIDPKNPKYGGLGYGGPSKSRPDLSNTAFFLESLEAAGVPKTDPAYQRAVRFISRCQNLSGEGANDLPQAEAVNDGGFYYTPAEDYNPGGKTDEGGLRSYASMTYAGLKSFIHAGVDKDDRRVQAAWEWVRKHYTLEENPGMGQAGLFYYYHTFAKALDLMEVDDFEAADGTKHDWRADLINTLAAKQQKDGSWSNSEKRWMESDGRLVTAYALMALSHAAR